MSYNFGSRNIKDSMVSNRSRMSTASTTFDSGLSPDNGTFYKALTGSKVSTNDDSDDELNPTEIISDSNVSRILRDTQKVQATVSFPMTSLRSTGSSTDHDYFRTDSPNGSIGSSDSQTKLILPSSVGFGHGVALNPANLQSLGNVGNKPTSEVGKSMREELKKKKTQAKRLPNGVHKQDSQISTIEAAPSPYEAKQTFRLSTLELDKHHQGEEKFAREKERKNCLRCTKIVLGVLFFLGMVAGVCVMIYALRDPEPQFKPPELHVQETTESVSSTTFTETTNTETTITTTIPTTTTTEIPPDFNCERDVKVLIRRSIHIACTISDTIDENDVSGILVTVPRFSILPGENATYELLFNSTVTNATERTWSYIRTNVNGTTKITLLGPAARCDSGGNYLVKLKGTEHEFTTFLVVTSHLSDVDFTIHQRNDTNYEIDCAVTSGCNTVSLNFLADYLNSSTTILRDVRFSCTISYDVSTGYSVRCQGVLHPDVFQTIQGLVCRPDSATGFTQEELKEKEKKLVRPECDLDTHCGYQCESYGDYYVVDTQVCDIFHRCYGKQVFTYACANGTYFVPARCTCDHKQTVNWCVGDGINVNDKKQDVSSCNTDTER